MIALSVVWGSNDSMLTTYCVTIMKQFTSRHSGVAELSTGLTACLECLTMEEPMCLEDNGCPRWPRCHSQIPVSNHHSEWAVDSSSSVLLVSLNSLIPRPFPSPCKGSYCSTSQALVHCHNYNSLIAKRPWALHPTYSTNRGAHTSSLYSYIIS